MSCTRCEDIHAAQKAGYNKLACSCECHSGFSWTPNYTITGTIDGDATDTNLTLCTPDGCSTVNLN